MRSTVAILAQGTNWAVAETQAFFIAVRYLAWCFAFWGAYMLKLAQGARAGAFACYPCGYGDMVGTETTK